MSMIDDMRKDREAGTPGPWVVPDQTYRRNLTIEVEGGDLIPCPGSGGAMSYTEDVCTLGWNKTELWLANARRIARVPDMEAALLAAEELAEAVAPFAASLERFSGFTDHALFGIWEDVNGAAGRKLNILRKQNFDDARAALAAYRAATDEAK